jgi:hypothetical protein
MRKWLLMKIAKVLLPARVRAKMTEGALIEAMGVDENTPWFQAVMQVLQEEGEMVVENLCAPRLTETERTYYAGGRAAVNDLCVTFRWLAGEGRARKAGLGKTENVKDKIEAGAQTAS